MKNFYQFKSFLYHCKVKILMMGFVSLMLTTLAAQDNLKPLNGQQLEYNGSGQVIMIKNYSDGKKDGWWTFNMPDSSKQYDLYRNDSLRRSIRLNTSRDTILNNRYQYYFSPYQLTRTEIYHGNSLSAIKYCAYDGSDSIIKALGPDNIFHLDPNYRGDDRICYNLDTKASFKGGMDGLGRFINQNLFYPKIAKIAGIEGTVFITFTIEPDGSVTGVKVSGNSTQMDPSLQTEAISVVQRSSGMWIPGWFNGKQVKSICNIPITFSISDDE